MRLALLPGTMRRLSRWPADHRVLALLLLISLALLGAVLAPRLPLQRLLLSPGAMLRVQAELPGVDAARVEALLARPLEKALVGLPGLRDLRARSVEGRAQIEMRFASTRDRDAALTQARARLESIAPDLPASMEPPLVEPYDPAQRPAAMYAITTYPISDDVAKWVEQALAAPLRELPEVASIAFDGADAGEIRIEPDPRRLAGLGLSFDDLVQALRRSDVAPPRRKGTTRKAPPVSGSAGAIAARAVRLPEGDAIALAEVARVALVSRPALDRPSYQGAPALRLGVYPRSAAEAPRVAERAQAHLAWLRANGLVPADIRVHPLLDESRELRDWLKAMLKLFGIGIAIAIVAAYLLFGARACLAVIFGFGIWLPAAAAALWALGFALTGMTAIGLVLAATLVALMVVRAVPLTVGVALAVTAMVLARLPGDVLGWYVQAADAFAVVSLLAVIVCWLMKPWLRTPDILKPPIARVLLQKSISWPRPLVAAAMILILGIAGATTVLLLPRAVNPNAGGTVAVRLYGLDPQQLQPSADDLLARLRATPGVDQIMSSSDVSEQWRLQLDSERLEDLGFEIDEIGRAFAIARDGLVVGEVADSEARLPLRLQLAAGAAGEGFETLLLRGEQKDQPAVYLRDLGSAVLVAEPNERVRVQGMPAVEITAQWRDADVLRELAGVRASIAAPAGFTFAWEVGAVPVPRGSQR